jgi:hypothetical protein
MLVKNLEGMDSMCVSVDVTCLCTWPCISLTQAVPLLSLWSNLQHCMRLDERGSPTQAKRDASLQNGICSCRPGKLLIGNRHTPLTWPGTLSTAHFPAHEACPTGNMPKASQL